MSQFEYKSVKVIVISNKKIFFFRQHICHCGYCVRKEFAMCCKLFDFESGSCGFASGSFGHAPRSSLSGKLIL